MLSRALARVGAVAAIGALPVATAATGAVAAKAAPTDVVRSQQQWVLNMLDVQPAWQVTMGANVTVAVLDSGVDPSASDLSNSVIPGPDYTGLHTQPNNPDWGQHGTWMASIIAGHGHNGGSDGFGPDGIIGIAPDAKILSIRVIPDMNDPGYHKYDSELEATIQKELAEGIIKAVKDHAQVISMSIGYSAPSGAVRAALRYADSRGTVLVASSGNSGNNDESRTHGWAPVSFPAEYPGVLGVGAVTRGGQPASFSSGNLSVKIAAPGDNVLAQGRDGLYYKVDGTSPACALVAGIAALIKSKYPAITPEKVIQALTSTAQHTSGYNVLTGFGIADAGAALAEAGKLMRERPAGSHVAVSAHFGGGAAAVPAAPVSPRGDGSLVVFAALAAISLAAVAGGLTALRQSRDPLRGGGGGTVGPPDDHD
jgi:hypothetical protein